MKALSNRNSLLILVLSLDSLLGMSIIQKRIVVSNMIIFWIMLQDYFFSSLIVIQRRYILYIGISIKISIEFELIATPSFESNWCRTILLPNICTLFDFQVASERYGYLNCRAFFLLFGWLLFISSKSKLIHLPPSSAIRNILIKQWEQKWL